MADKPTNQSKRQVKNPESFRERANKASSEKPDISVSKYAKLYFESIFSPIGCELRKFFGLKIFKPLRRPAKIIGKILLPPYLRKSFSELKLVTWPNWTQSRQLTFAVLVFAVVFGASIAGIDWGLDKIFRNVLLK